MILRDLLPAGRPVLPSIAPQASVAAALVRLVQSRKAFLVIQDDGRPLGLFAPAEALTGRALSTPEDLTRLRLADLSLGFPVQAGPEESARAGLQRLLDHGHSLLPVLEGVDLLGVLELPVLVRGVLGELTAEIETLDRYIQNLHDADRD